MNEQLLIAVVNGEKCNVFCSSRHRADERKISFIYFLEKLHLEYEVEDNMIRVGKGFIVFTVK